eukprot:6603192-Prymnesium_polylepis.1
MGHLGLDFHDFGSSLTERKREPGPTCSHTVCVKGSQRLWSSMQNSDVRGVPYKSGRRVGAGRLNGEKGFFLCDLPAWGQETVSRSPFQRPSTQ